MNRFTLLKSWFSTTRRKFLGGTLLGAGALLTNGQALGQQLTKKGNVLFDRIPKYPPGLEDAAKFTLMDALYGSILYAGFQNVIYFVRKSTFSIRPEKQDMGITDYLHHPSIPCPLSG